MSDLYYRFSNSMDIADKVAHLQKEASALQAAANIANSDAIREVAGLYASFAGCMAMLAKQLPYKKGDRIRLTKAPVCEGGWASSKHFLIVGAIGTVRAVELDYLMRDWSVLLEFDLDSYICPWDEKDHKKGDKIFRTPNQRSGYAFKPSFIEPLPPCEEDSNRCIQCRGAVEPCHCRFGCPGGWCTACLGVQSTSYAGWTTSG